MSKPIRLGLAWGRNLRDGKLHEEWAAICGCAYHPRPSPHIHSCVKHQQEKRKCGT